MDAASTYLHELWLAKVPVSQTIHAIYGKFNIVLSGHVVDQTFSRWEQEAQNGVSSLKVKYTLARIAGTAA